MTTEFQRRFKDLVDQNIEGQLEFFLKRYIFVLGEDWKQAADLATKFSNYADARNGNDLNVTEAADFLQKNGKTRTAKERSDELKDVDLDSNGRICFIEYLLLHYKVIILKDYFRMKNKVIPKEIDLSKDGIGVTGVGDYILEALFTFGQAVDPKIEAAIEQVMKERKEREDKMSELKGTVEDTTKSQVQRMKAQHELLKIEHEDTSGADVALIKLMAGRRRVEREAKNGSEKNEKELQKEKEAQEAEKQRKANESKGKLTRMMSSFTSNAKTDEAKYLNKANDRASIKAIRSKGLNLYTESARKEM